jgi:ATP-dependent RNA helicase RhlE
MSEEKKVKIYYDARSVTLRTPQTVQFVQEHDKLNALALTLKAKETLPSLIFTKSKRQAESIVSTLKEQGIKIQAIHGNNTKETQQERVESFNKGETDIIVTTDTIFQTLELKSPLLVISYDLPNSPQDYFNRVASTKELGVAIALVSPEDDRLLTLIEHNIKADIEESIIEGFVATPSSKQIKKKKKPRHKKTKTKKNSKVEEKEL